MNRIDRLSAIIVQLQSKKVVKAQEIADRFEISLRTVYRDIRAIEEAGVPVGAEAGKGYFLMEGYSLPPVSFTKEEAGAILLAAKLAEKNTDRSIQKHFDDALFKIKAALRVQEKDYLEQLESNIEVLQSPIPRNDSEQFPDHFLADIQNALAQKRLLNFDYYSNYSDQFTNRDVEPYGLCFYSSRWHLIGYCRLRNDLRDFRTDRIMKLKQRDDFFNDKKIEFEDYLQNITMGSDLQEAVVTFDKQVSRYISEQKYYQGLVEEKKHDKTIEMKFMTSNLNFLARWLMMFEDKVIIHSPQELKNIVYQIAQNTWKHHKI